MVKDPPWLAYARRQIGVREIAGPRHEPRVLAMWRRIGRWAGIAVQTDEVPWCGAFVADCLLTGAGIKPVAISARARAWATWGGPISLAATRPPLGAIAVFGREGGGHVGFVVAAHHEGSLDILGGNQGNAVNIRRFPRSRLIALRWPAGVPMVDSVQWATTPGVSTTGEA